MLDLVERFRKRSFAPEVPTDAVSLKNIEKQKSSIYTKREITHSVGTIEVNEIDRITALPLVESLTPEEALEWERTHVLASAFDEGFRLFPDQVEAGLSFQTFGGAFCTIGVGFGKTLASLLIASLAYQKRMQKMILFVPPDVLPQLVEKDIKWVRGKIPIPYPIFILGNKPLLKRREIAKSDRMGLYIMTYSLLSATDGEDLLQNINPDLIICDEAHNIARTSSARTKRLWHFVDGRAKDGDRVAMAALSGSMAQKSLNDFWKILVSCLGHNSPVPLMSTLAHDWAALIDAAVAEWSSTSGMNTGPLEPLVEWAKKYFPKDAQRLTTSLAGFRHAFQKRLTSAPGVVDSGERKIRTSLVIQNRPIPKHKEHPQWPELEALGNQVEDAWLTPNGDEIKHALHKFKWLFEIYGGGFYNQLTWPVDEVLAQRRNIPTLEARELLEQAMVHHEAGQLYSRSLRAWLEDNHIKGLDTPYLVGNSMFQHGSQEVGEDLYNVWKDWKDLDFEGRPVRDKKAVRVCSYKIDNCLKWAKEEVPQGEGALIWVINQEVGLWLVDTLREAGVNYLHCPAGNQGNAGILDERNADKIIVASLPAHNQGKNLQHFRHQYYLQWPRPAKQAQQSLGRTHRSGQKAEQLLVRTIHTTEFDYMNFAACLLDALYVHQTLRSRQKLIYATYDPLPTIFPAAVLRERGFELSDGSERLQASLLETFSTEKEK